MCKDIPLAAWLVVSEIVDSEDSWVTQSYISISKMPEITEWPSDFWL
jgi:hypothetical protein